MGKQALCRMRRSVSGTAIHAIVFCCLIVYAVNATNENAESEAMATATAQDLMQDHSACEEDLFWCKALAVGWTQVKKDGAHVVKDRRLRLVRFKSDLRQRSAAPFQNSFDSTVACHFYTCNELATMIEGHFVVSKKRLNEPWLTSFHRAAGFQGTSSHAVIDLKLEKTLLIRDCTPTEKAAKVTSCNNARRRRRRRKRDDCDQALCEHVTVSKNCTVLYEPDLDKIVSMGTNPGIKDECAVL